MHMYNIIIIIILVRVYTEHVSAFAQAIYYKTTALVITNQVQTCHAENIKISEPYQW